MSILNDIDFEIELIERFMSEYLPLISPHSDIREVFDAYWDEAKQNALITLSKEEGLVLKGLEKLHSNYLYTNKPPMRDEVIAIMETPPSLRNRKTIAERVIEKIINFFLTFVEGVD